MSKGVAGQAGSSVSSGGSAAVSDRVSVVGESYVHESPDELGSRSPAPPPPSLSPSSPSQSAEALGQGVRVRVRHAGWRSRSCSGSSTRCCRATRSAATAGKSRISRRRSGSPWSRRPDEGSARPVRHRDRRLAARSARRARARSAAARARSCCAIWRAARWGAPRCRRASRRWARSRWSTIITSAISAASLTDLQHELGDGVRSALHVHLSHDLCLEVVVMRGQSDQLQAIADRILAMRGVKQGGIEIIAGLAASPAPASTHAHEHAHAHAPVPRAAVPHAHPTGLTAARAFSCSTIRRARAIAGHDSQESCYRSDRCPRAASIRSLSVFGLFFLSGLTGAPARAQAPSRIGARRLSRPARVDDAAVAARSSGGAVSARGARGARRGERRARAGSRRRPATSSACA